MPPRVWRVLRWLVVACALGLVYLAIVCPALALRLFWGIFVPILPLSFLVAPGLWRNVCPLVSLNQIPRTVGFTRGLTIPPEVQRFAPLVSASLFFLIIPMRKVLLDANGLALAILILTLLSLAFLGGVLFKGKSGWCTQFCPMLQVERLFGQSPLVVVPNGHCSPCVGCSVNCHDFNPTAGYLADLYDENPHLGTNRKLFAGALPWLTLAFFTQPYLSEVSVAGVAQTYAYILFFAAAGIGIFFVLNEVIGVTSQRLILWHATAAINLYYLFAVPLILERSGVTPWLQQGIVMAPSVNLPAFFGSQITPALLPQFLLQAGVLAISAVWLRRALPRERAFLSVGNLAPARASESVVQAARQAGAAKVEVQFQSGPTVLAESGDSLLALAEANHVAIDAGCRLGMCGADPIAILAGAESLSPALLAEQSTLQRLGLGPAYRMACCVRVHGPVTVAVADPSALMEEASAQSPEATAEEQELARDGRHIVVIGSGVAGMTAAVEARQRLPGAEVSLIGGESYEPYNRLNLGKLVNESVAIEKLYLMPREWAAAKRIRFLKGVRVTAIDRAAHQVDTELGETLPYDHLILAMGARSAVPPTPGFGTPGTFVMRTMDDAIQLQQYIRNRRARRAVVIGGGLLGLEAAYFISHMGVHVFVLERGEWPLSRQLDQPAGRLLERLMSGIDIEIVTRAEVQSIMGPDIVTGVELKDGQTIPADLCLVAVGIEPNSELAREAGLEVNRGVVVNDHMQTSDPAIFAAGDVAEHNGRVYGLWPASLEQARVAVLNACGGDIVYEGVVPPAKLKVAAFDLLSVGEITAKGDDGHEIVLEDSGGGRYRKLVLKDGRALGAILIGYTELADSVCLAVESRQDVRDALPELEQGDWSALGSTTRA
ncbi:MAG: hypothetical protein EXR50_03540 [Dehalococcoidia bacterium]|nr:hypothetical protein [Dehalococcoidia bacterium]